MQLVIDILEEEYRVAKYGQYGNIDIDIVRTAIRNGTPLPKGHGRLVDYDKMKRIAAGYGAYTEATLSHIKPDVMVPADKEVPDADSN